ncbi:hypothetical protein J2S04_002134 [Alicyclobacillus tengchongensis]|uniref:Uncharacterized protein n=2 Tax=Alicyclobacillus tolerans TaxID=90970 RepID=A0ABT9LY25_9BACL|nr:hypothetical protein [Alicyclobacillus tengchongensis]SHK02352.1 hypothetical protein SAMN05443507_10773 [Alicyclobacillus montanus]
MEKAYKTSEAEEGSAAKACFHAPEADPFSYFPSSIGFFRLTSNHVSQAFQKNPNIFELVCSGKTPP